MSQPPPVPVASSAAGTDTELRFGQPIKRRRAVPLMLVIGVAVATTLLFLHDKVVYYRVDSGSMRPTLQIGSRVAVEPGRAPEVGDIVVFHPPAGATPATPVCGAFGQGSGFRQPCGEATSGASRAVFIKRIVAGPGDLVLIRGGRTVINGIASSEPFAASCAGLDCNFPTPIRVPAGEFYVLGDNRGGSDDSRFWGPIPSASILGVLVSCHPLQTACQPRH